MNPCSPGQLGGQYKPLNPTEIIANYDTALRLLAELAIGKEIEARIRSEYNILL